MSLPNCCVPCVDTCAGVPVFNLQSQSTSKCWYGPFEMVLYCCDVATNSAKHHWTVKFAETAVAPAHSSFITEFTEWSVRVVDRPKLGLLQYILVSQVDQQHLQYATTPLSQQQLGAAGERGPQCTLHRCNLLNTFCWFHSDNQIAVCPTPPPTCICCRDGTWQGSP